MNVLAIQHKNPKHRSIEFSLPHQSRKVRWQISFAALEQWQSLPRIMDFDSLLRMSVGGQSINTTRDRLIGTMRTPFSLYRGIKVEIPGNNISCTGAESNQTKSLKDFPSLDYWEIETDWDGQIFHSVFQALCTNNSTENSLEIKLPVAPTKVSVRAVSVDESVIQLNI
jgi:hypothetical protein